MDFSQGNTRSCFLFLADMDRSGVVNERQMDALDAHTRVAAGDLALRRAAKPEPNSSTHHPLRLSGEAPT